eukprot:1425827-Rhodomonas_salina.1
MMIGGREEAEEEAASEEEEEEETDKAFTTSSLVRSVELVALQMSAEARAELLAMMQDLFHRFHLVKMETDAQAETEVPHPHPTPHTPHPTPHTPRSGVACPGCSCRGRELGGCSR